jgi:hypothetical protein
VAADGCNCHAADWAASYTAPLVPLQVPGGAPPSSAARPAWLHRLLGAVCATRAQLDHQQPGDAVRHLPQPGGNHRAQLDGLSSNTGEELPTARCVAFGKWVQPIMMKIMPVSAPCNLNTHTCFLGRKVRFKDQYPLCQDVFTILAALLSHKRACW